MKLASILLFAVMLVMPGSVGSQTEQVGTACPKREKGPSSVVLPPAIWNDDSTVPITKNAYYSVKCLQIQGCRDDQLTYTFEGWVKETK